jgi:hypothetical protein
MILIYLQICRTPPRTLVGLDCQRSALLSEYAHALLVFHRTDTLSADDAGAGVLVCAGGTQRRTARACATQPIGRVIIPSVPGNGDRAMPSPTRFLLDTNAFIALEPFAGQMESGLGPAATFIRLATKQDNRVFVHPATKDELGEGKNRVRAQQRIAELNKFEMLAEAPISASLRDAIGRLHRSRYLRPLLRGHQYRSRDHDP